MDLIGDQTGVGAGDTVTTDNWTFEVGARNTGAVGHKANLLIG